MTQPVLKVLLENCVLSLKVHTIARTIDIFINVGHKVMPSQALLSFSTTNFAIARQPKTLQK